MALREEFRSQGNWLFRRRSFLPLCLLPLLLPALTDSARMERLAGTGAMELFRLACLAITLAGLLVRARAIGCAASSTSGRNRAGQVAESLNSTGMYSLIRHPLYFGNFLMMMGVLCSLGVWWLALIAALAFTLYYERIMFAEEAFLREKFSRTYQDWADATPAFLPGLRNHRPADLPFSLRRVLRKEPPAWLGAVTAFTCLAYLRGFTVEGRFEYEALWTPIFLLAVFLFVVLLILRSKTRILHRGGR